MSCMCVWDKYCHVLCSDLAPGNDEIHEETQEKFLTPGNPQEGQVILYKVHVRKGCIKLIKSDSKDIYNVTEDFYFK